MAASEEILMHIQLMASDLPLAPNVRVGSDLATPGEQPATFAAQTLTDPDLLFIVGLSPQQRPWQTMLYHLFQGPLFTELALATVIDMYERQYRAQHYSIAAQITADWQQVLTADNQVREAGGAGIKNLQRFRHPPRMPACVGRALWSPRPSHPEAVWFFTHACFDVQADGSVMRFTTSWGNCRHHWLAWADPGSPKLADQALIDELIKHAYRRLQWLAAADVAKTVAYYHEHNLQPPPEYAQAYAAPPQPLQAQAVAGDLDNVAQMVLGRKASANARDVYAMLGDWLADEAR